MGVGFQCNSSAAFGLGFTLNSDAIITYLLSVVKGGVGRERGMEFLTG